MLYLASGVQRPHSAFSKNLYIGTRPVFFWENGERSNTGKFTATPMTLTFDY